MAEPICDILIFFFRFYFNIIFISFSIEMFSNRSVESFSFPFSDMLEIVFLMEWSICNESIFVCESEILFFIVIYSIKSEILKLMLFKFITQVCIDTFNTSFIGSVEVADGIPYLFLNFKIVLKICYNFIVLFNFCLFVIFIEFGVNVFW